MKPELPKEVQDLLPKEIVNHIRRFVPHIKKDQPVSPSLIRELERIQRSPLHGKNEMYLKGFDDFILE
jgi:hypothetical protein